MIPRIPKRLCNQTITLLVPTGKMDKVRKPVTETIMIDHVIVQPQTIYSGSNNDRTVTGNAIVFIFAEISDPMPKLTPDCVGWHLTFEGRDYAITNFVDNRDPYSNDVYSYELEVI
ncbi:putative minor capsid protein [Limosilactobacillus fermentum]|uniref:putative minor capsid protein n=1 Tax=Limosilactobacillus fermentum TaxID=1613 RepID=UPI000FECB220|nr:putative minor capsid protein [Limosilactobacillus fermentum]QAR22376.1 capsid protein [Limosilactobacillus fermentum]